MLVETYEVEEVGQHPEVDQEAVALAERLGLTAQVAMASRNDAGLVTRVPYRYMTEREQFIYGVLCPQHVPVEGYASGPIPLRVLQVFEHARSLDHFKRFEVWAPRDASIRDPLLVGLTWGANEWTGQRLWLLARWGEVLDSLPTLAVEAGRRWKAAMVSKIAKVEDEVRSERARLEATPDDQIVDMARNPYNTGDPAFTGILA